jgi:hypothetical protein
VDKKFMTGFSEDTICALKKHSALAVIFIILALFSACRTTSVKSMNFTAYANEYGEKYHLYFFNSRKYLSLKPTGGKIIWDDYIHKQKHVATYFNQNNRYLLNADAGGATGNPSTRVIFPLLSSNSATQCHFYLEISDSYYINGYEQELKIYDSQQSKIDDLFIWFPNGNVDNRDIFGITRVIVRNEGNPYYLITRIFFNRDFILYGNSKDDKIFKIYKGSYITFQYRNFFKAYRGVFVD